MLIQTHTHTHMQRWWIPCLGSLLYWRCHARDGERLAAIKRSFAIETTGFGDIILFTLYNILPSRFPLQTLVVACAYGHIVRYHIR